MAEAIVDDMDMIATEFGYVMIYWECGRRPPELARLNKWDVEVPFWQKCLLNKVAEAYECGFDTRDLLWIGRRSGNGTLLIRAGACPPEWFEMFMGYSYFTDRWYEIHDAMHRRLKERTEKKDG